MADSPPVVPPEFRHYNSHKIDPIYQRKFTISWICVAMGFILPALPSFVRSVRTARVYHALSGMKKSIDAYEPVDIGREEPSSHPEEKRTRSANNLFSLLKVSTMRTYTFLRLDVAQLVFVLGYFVLVIVCFTLKTQLVENPNRPGFIAVAQLPPIFLLAMKNSPLAIFLSSGYEKLNFLHRWCSRAAILAAAIHGFLWIRNRIAYDLPILGKRKDATGIISLLLMCILGITSIRPVRVRVFQIFRIIHLLAVPAFSIAMRYHTKHTIPYLYPALALWTVDLLLRVFRFRIRTAILVVPDTQMTIVRIQDCASGWTAGQHVRLRVFFPYRVFESHALTIMNAPRRTTCHDYARRRNAVFIGDEGEEAASQTGSKLSVASGIVIEDGESIHLTELSKAENASEILLPKTSSWSPADQFASVQVMVDGPYGGCSFDPGTFECILFVAGGSGVTFTLGLVDDLIGRCLKLGRPDREVTRRVEFAWYIRSLSTLRWVSSLLSCIASRVSASSSTLNLHITIYITHSSHYPPGEDTPSVPVPNCDVIFEKPPIREIIEDFASASEVADAENAGTTLISDKGSEGIAICAAGPESLTNEVKNFVAGFALRNRRRRIDCHTEAYFL